MYDEPQRGLKARLRQFAKKISRRSAAALPLSSLIQRTGQTILLPFYHLVRDEACPYVDPLYQVRSVAQFRKDLDYLLQYYEPIDLSQLLKITTGELPMPQKGVMHLSFDDGLRECAEIIAPILLEKGVPASFFVNTAFIDNKDLMFRYKTAFLFTYLKELSATDLQHYLAVAKLHHLSDILKLGHEDQALIEQLAHQLELDYKTVLEKEQPYMTTAQLQQLLEQGFSLGSHSIDHPLYKKISIEEQWRQTIEGQRQLEALFDLSYRIFAFPFTDDLVSKAFFERLFEKEAFDLTFGGAGVKIDTVSRNLQRLPMESTPLLEAAEILKTDYFYFMLKSLLGKHKIHRV